MEESKATKAMEGALRREREYQAALYARNKPLVEAIVARRRAHRAMAMKRLRPHAHDVNEVMSALGKRGEETLRRPFSFDPRSISRNPWWNGLPLLLHGWEFTTGDVEVLDVDEDGITFTVEKCRSLSGNLGQPPAPLLCFLPLEKLSMSDRDVASDARSLVRRAQASELREMRELEQHVERSARRLEKAREYLETLRARSDLSEKRMAREEKNVQILEKQLSNRSRRLEAMGGVERLRSLEKLA